MRIAAYLAEAPPSKDSQEFEVSNSQSVLFTLHATALSFYAISVWILNSNANHGESF